ncbi:MAG: Crp/Fnr family transcriptional regulator [Rhodocyclaceae bacterium]|nr:Crp/Fnr family transcriptional regulator [Rhodocyclaceae bacterium]
MTEQIRPEPTIAGLLRVLPMFAQLATAQIEQVAAACREKRVAKGEMLFQRGDRPRGFFVVVSGQMKLAMSSPQGQEKVVEIIGPRHSFGEAVMFMDRPYPVFAEATTDTVVLHIPRQTVTDLIERDRSFALAMLAGLSIRLHSLVQDVESYSLRSSSQRVIGYLLQLCPPEGEGTVEVALPIPKQLIASLLNLTPETFSRILHDLDQSGLIEVRGKQIGIADLRRLREFDF